MTELTAPVLIKVGTGVLTLENGQLDIPALERLVTAIVKLSEVGYRCILISSGAVGAGVPALNLSEYPQDLASKQAAAAVGQTRLMQMYHQLFSDGGFDVAQILLTAHDLSSEKRRKRIAATLERLLKEPYIIPVINENDTVAVAELRFTDNDMLSARVAELIGARLLVLLTSVDGLLHPDTKELVSAVDDIDSVRSYVQETQGRFSIGGMASKLNAVQRAVDAKIECVIANGEHPERLAEIVKGKGRGTRFLS